MSLDDLARDVAQVAHLYAVLLGQANVIRSMTMLGPRVAFAQGMHMRRTKVVWINDDPIAANPEQCGQYNLTLRLFQNLIHLPKIENRCTVDGTAYAPPAATALRLWSSCRRSVR